MKNLIVPASAALLVAALSGCVVGEGVNALVHTGSGTFERINRQRAIERVARDWCLTLRAAQVIPVFPLREDIEPGRILIVQSSITELKDHLNRKGYLPFETEFDQLKKLNYGDFYESAFGVTGKGNPFNKWRTAGWDVAPYGGFPTFSYTVHRSEGFSGALPISSVPTMLTAVNARNAQVSVTLKDVFTVGLTAKQIRTAMNNWIAEEDNRYHLKIYAPKEDARTPQKRYLRVITRVYLVKRVTVSVTNLAASSSRASAGDPKPLNNLFAAEGEAVANFNKAVEAMPKQELTAVQIPSVPDNLADVPTDPLAPQPVDSEAKRIALERERLKNERLKLENDIQASKLSMAERQLQGAEMTSRFGGTVLPGGTAALASASKGSVTMDEEFKRPIVIGYEAVDYEIYRDVAGGGTIVPSEFISVARRVGL